MYDHDPETYRSLFSFDPVVWSMDYDTVFMRGRNAGAHKRKIVLFVPQI